MAVKVAKIAKVMLGEYVVAEMGIYTMSGFAREALDSSAFQDDVKPYVFGVGDAGEITFSGNYDATDSNGQTIIEAACSNASLFPNDALRFYVDSTSYWRVATNNNLLITKCKAIAFDKAGIGTTEFTAKVSGGGMYLATDVPSASPSISPSDSPSASPSDSPSASPS